MQNGANHDENGEAELVQPDDGSDGSDDGGDAVEPTADEYRWLQEQMAAAGFHAVGGDGDWEDPTGGPLAQLLAACEQGAEARVAELLTSFPGDVNAPGPDGDTALHLACLFGNSGCVRALLDNGADANTVNREDGSTALHDAAAGGYLDICEMVLAKARPSMVNRADEDGDTPLHNAARGNHADVVRLLLARGADKAVQNGYGNTPKDEAEEEEVIALL